MAGEKNPPNMAQPLPSDMPASASTCEIAWGSAFWYPSRPRQILSCEGLVWAKDLRLRWLEPTMEARLFAVLLPLHAWQAAKLCSISPNFARPLGRSPGSCVYI